MATLSVDNDYIVPNSFLWDEIKDSYTRKPSFNNSFDVETLRRLLNHDPNSTINLITSYLNGVSEREFAKVDLTKIVGPTMVKKENSYWGSVPNIQTLDDLNVFYTLMDFAKRDPNYFGGHECADQNILSIKDAVEKKESELILRWKLVFDHKYKDFQKLLGTFTDQFSYAIRLSRKGGTSLKLLLEPLRSTLLEITGKDQALLFKKTSFVKVLTVISYVLENPPDDFNADNFKELHEFSKKISTAWQAALSFVGKKEEEDTFKGLLKEVKTALEVHC